MKFFSALRIADYAVKFCQTLGLNVEELIAKGDPVGAAQAHLASQKPALDAAKAVAALTEENGALTAALTSAKKELEEASAKFSAELATANAKIEAALGQVDAFKSGLSAAGVKVADGADSATVTKAIDDRASIKARERLAKHGINEHVAVEPTPDPSKPNKAEKKNNLTGLARMRAATWDAPVNGAN